jgi:hypothetical protein
MLELELQRLQKNCWRNLGLHQLKHHFTIAMSCGIEANINHHASELSKIPGQYLFSGGRTWDT